MALILPELPYAINALEATYHARNFRVSLW